MNPYVTQRVWYYPVENDPEVPTIRGHGNTQPCSGEVNYVWPDGRVNLDVTDHYSCHTRKTSVRFLQPGERAERDYCTQVVVE